jgi:hypothetical protein
MSDYYLLGYASVLSECAHVEWSTAEALMLLAIESILEVA